MENPPFWWYLPGKMWIFMGYVSFREGRFYVILEYLRFYLDLFPNSTMRPRLSNWWRFIKIGKSRSGPRHLPRLAVRSLRRSRTPQISMATLEDHLTSWPLGIPWWTTTISIWEFGMENKPSKSRLFKNGRGLPCTIMYWCNSLTAYLHVADKFQDG